jgi:hypothetical protein
LVSGSRDSERGGEARNSASGNHELHLPKLPRSHRPILWR